MSGRSLMEPAIYRVFLAVLEWKTAEKFPPSARQEWVSVVHSASCAQIRRHMKLAR